MSSAHATSKPILQVRDLRTHFGPIRAVDGVFFHINAGETVAIVGESGCGKSVTALSILRLVPPSVGGIVGGEILFGEEDLCQVPMARLRQIRGNSISMIFQEPMTSLNPVLTVGRQISEVLELHQRMGRKAALTQAVELLRQVHVADPERRVHEFPHQLSGGMRQRVMIAMALACQPQLLIADEPTTALDVTVQAQVLKLIGQLARQNGTAVMLITHDLGVVAEAAQRVIVMYAGRKVEEALVGELFDRPLHPYTRGLMASVLHCDDDEADAIDGQVRRKLPEIPGMVPVMSADVKGCAFAPRCALASARCRQDAPPQRFFSNAHEVACWEVAPEASNDHA